MQSKRGRGKDGCTTDDRSDFTARAWAWADGRRGRVATS